MFKNLASVLLIVFFALQVLAGSYTEFLREFPVEVRGFDATTEAKEVVDAFEKDWTAYIEKGTAIPEKWKSSYTWSPILKAYLQNQHPISGKQKSEIRKLEIRGDFSGEHSIEDAELYSEQRIGENIVKVLKADQIPVIVYGGAEESLIHSLKISPEHFFSIPSPYEAWGLKKLLISEKAFADGKARFVMLIPPSVQYISHYTKMFQYLNIKVEKNLLNVSDQQMDRVQLKSAFLRLQKRMGFSPDVVVLGYYNNFSQIPGAELQFQEEVKMGNGLTVRMMRDRKTKLNYLLMKSDLTIWGESSAILVEAALATNPKSVIFMGSAGGITPSTGVYDVSVPKEFSLEGEKLGISNFLYESLRQQNVRDANIVMGGIHGHTNSPIEQTKAYVSGKIAAGITTIDVEQNLIAKTVLLHNQKTGSQIRFGAINLITDKPESNTYHWDHDSDLTRIDHTKKAAARILAVSSALKGTAVNLRMNPVAPSTERRSTEIEIRSCKKVY